MFTWLKKLAFSIFPSPHIVRVDWREDTHDTANMLLETAFVGLQRYVEIEKAMVWVVTKKLEGPTWYNWLWWNSPEYGVLRLREEQGFTLDGEPSETAKLASEIYELYNWFVNERQTVDDLRGSFEFSATNEVDLIDLEEEALRKDDEMFKRLAAIRQHLIS
jgi:hypothetical protein